MLGFSFRILYLFFFLCLAWAAAEIDKQWTESSRYKKTVLCKKRAALTDFQRFKVKLLKRQVSHNYSLNILYELAGGVFSGRQKLPVFKFFIYSMAVGLQFYVEITNNSHSTFNRQNFIFHDV